MGAAEAAEAAEKAAAERAAEEKAASDEAAAEKAAALLQLRLQNLEKQASSRPTFSTPLGSRSDIASRQGSESFPKPGQVMTWPTLGSQPLTSEPSNLSSTQKYIPNGSRTVNGGAASRSTGMSE